MLKTKGIRSCFTGFILLIIPCSRKLYSRGKASHKKRELVQALIMSRSNFFSEKIITADTFLPKLGKSGRPTREPQFWW